MPRTQGSRNADYAEERTALVTRLRAALVTHPSPAQLSFRQLAALADVSAPTLRHYFANREGVFVAVLEDMHRQGLPYLAAAATLPIADARQSLRWFLESLLFGWRAGVEALHRFGLTAGMGHPVLGPAYVQEILEPTLQALEARLARHVADGTLVARDVRHAALELLSPVVLALLHQDGLGGTRCRPLDVARFVEDLLESFLRAHEPRPRVAASKPEHST